MKDASLNSITKEDLVRFVLKKENISQKELIEKIQADKEINIPVSIFTTKLSPLESITRYLKENLNKRITEIAKILNKKAPIISLAYKKAKSKEFKTKKTKIFILLSEFQNNPKLSILEIVVQSLRNKNFKFLEIAQRLKRDPKTIWTVFNRGQKKKK